MGSEVIATCECGYRASSLIGGGMMNFMTVCYFPALCERCGELVQINLFKKRVRCPRCKSSRVRPYDDDDLVDGVGRREVVSWNVYEELGRALSLTDRKYLCPSCRKYKLKFKDSGLCWD